MLSLLRNESIAVKGVLFADRRLEKGGLVFIKMLISVIKLFNPLPTQQCCTHCFLFLQQIVNKSMRYALFIRDLRIT